MDSHTGQKETPLLFDEVMTNDSLRMALSRALGRRPSFDLACVGASLHGLGGFTFEALAYMICADVVFCYPSTTAHYELMKLVNTNVVNLQETLYVRGKAFDATYEEIIDHVIDTLRRGKRVAYATQGSPAFYCGTCVKLYRTARKEGFSSVIVPGVSSFEIVIAELALFSQLRNIQIINVRDMMEGNLSINLHISCLLVDLGRYALPAVREPASALLPRKVAAFADFLRGIYSTDHQVTLMYVKSNDGVCLKFQTSLGELEDAIRQFGQLPTIFVPPKQTS